MTEDEEEVVVAVDDGAFYGALVEDDPADLYDNAPCAYLSTLPDGTIVKANATFLHWTGFVREDLVGRRRFQELLAPGDRIFYETHYSPALRIQGQVREIAVELVGSTGARLPVLVNAVLKRDPDGNPLVIRTAVFDATERRAYERELLAARRRAEESEAKATSLARTLQATLLPPELPRVPGLDLGGAYRPAGDGSEVGGDFYDVFQTAPSAWGLVLGDVCGKGAGAAVLTSLARYAVRAESQRVGDPSEVLARLHQTFLRDHPDRFCTAIVACLDTRPDAEGARRLTVASGGHHLPLLLRGGEVSSVGEIGSIVGLLDEIEVHDQHVELRPGDVVVLYTDGVTEARSPAGFLDEAGLRDSILAAAADANGAQAIADAIVADAVEYQGGMPRDDIAVLVLRIPPAPALD